MAMNLPLLVMGTATALVSGWSFYNAWRFAGRERRRPSGRVLGEALAVHFCVDPIDLAHWQGSRRLVVKHDTRGLVTSVETARGVDRVVRRPVDHADPLPYIEGLVVERESPGDGPRPSSDGASQWHTGDEPLDIDFSLPVESGDEFLDVDGGDTPFLLRRESLPTHEPASTVLMSAAEHPAAADHEPLAVNVPPPKVSGPNTQTQLSASVAADDGKVPPVASSGVAPEPIAASMADFDPSLLDDLGLFVPETPSHLDWSADEVEEPQPAATEFQHTGRVYYF